MDDKTPILPRHGQLESIIKHIYMDGAEAIRQRMNAGNESTQRLFGKVDYLSTTMRREEDIIRDRAYLK